MMACRKSVLALLALSTLAAGCRTTTEAVPSTLPAISRGELTGTWRLVEGGELLGFVVHFEEPGVAGRGFFSVRNPHHQELGLIDRHGRAYRYRPHEREPEWVATGTVLEGAREILGAGAQARLEDLPQAAEEP